MTDALSPLAATQAVIWGGLLIGLVLGAAAQASRFCTMGALTDWFSYGGTARLTMWILAVGVAATGSMALVSAGVFDATQTLAAVARAHVAAGVRAAQGDPGPDVGMDPAIRADGPRVPEHGPQSAIRRVLLVAESVAVLDQHVPAADLPSPRPEPVVEAEILAQDRAAPAVVVPGDPEDRQAAIAQPREFAEHPHAGARHHLPPLEPEVEEVQDGIGSESMMEDESGKAVRQALQADEISEE